MDAHLKRESSIYLLPFEQAKERSECGGKAATLSVLLQAGFSVPQGFVIKTQGVEALVGKLGQDAQNLALKELDDYISFFSAESAFAVRSSAVVEDSQTSSFAGIFHTELNVKPELTAILHAIMICHEAVYNERVYQYMDRRNIPHNEGMLALIVQQMVQPDTAGVAFSKSFTSQGSPQILIEAVAGLGENLVSGRQTPTRFLIPRLSEDRQEAFLLTEHQKQGADLPQLRESVLEQLCKDILKIEQLFSAPQDIEWCSLADKLFILQSRPITSELRLGEGEEATFAQDCTTLRGYGAAPGITTGTTFVVEDESVVEAFPDGAILLATSTDTDYLTAMQRASAIVTEEGGLLSHAALISRELRIPCVVGAAGVLVKFPTGTLVTVDGYTGTIQTGKGARRRLDLDLHDKSDLFCFDSVQLISMYGLQILLEPAYLGPVIYMPSTINKEKEQMIVSAIQKEVSSDIRLGLSPKYEVYFSWKSNMQGNPLFRDLFFNSVRACTEMFPEMLEQLITHTYLFTLSLLSELEYTTNDLSVLLTAYAKLNTAQGNYMLVNTLLPEGYGIWSVYQALSPYFTAHQISFGEFLTLRGQMKDDLGSRIFAVYDLLTKSRESSYPKYEKLGATGPIFSQRWRTVLDGLARLLGLNPEAEDFRSRLFQRVEAAKLWHKIYPTYKQLFPDSLIKPLMF